MSNWVLLSCSGEDRRASKQSQIGCVTDSAGDELNGWHPGRCLLRLRERLSGSPSCNLSVIDSETAAPSRCQPMPRCHQGGPSSIIPFIYNVETTSYSARFGQNSRGKRHTFIPKMPISEEEFFYPLALMHNNRSRNLLGFHIATNDLFPAQNGLFQSCLAWNWSFWISKTGG